MKQLQHKIELAIYGYEPSKFMPIFQDGHFANRNQFIAYKLKQVAARAIPALQ